MTESILTTAKKLITGLTEEDTTFDVDIIIHANTVLNILSELGAGDPSYQIEDKDNTWDEFIAGKAYLNMCKSYMALKVRMLFDPPTAGPIIESYNKQLGELEWRINAVADPKDNNKLAEE